MEEKEKINAPEKKGSEGGEIINTETSSDSAMHEKPTKEEGAENRDDEDTEMGWEDEDKDGDDDIDDGVGTDNEEKTDWEAGDSSNDDWE